MAEPPRPAPSLGELVAKRWHIHYVVATGEFLVWDKTNRCLRGQAVVCKDEAAVIRHIQMALREENMRRF